MEQTLDDIAYLKSLDKNNMLEAISEFSDNARKAINSAEKIDLGDILNEKFSALIICGMGGSAVGGLLLRDWLKDTCEIPIFVSRSYYLPAWVNEKTVVFAVSYSGNTEETISQYHEAIQRGCKIIAFCSGGKLSQNAALRKIPRVKYSKGYQPRAAISLQFFSIATIVKRLGLIGDLWGEVEEALEVLDTLKDEMAVESTSDTNPAKELANSIFGYIPLIYGGPLYKSVVYRYTTQLNENSKTPAGTNFFPEAFHNAVMAREAKKNLLERMCVIIIKDPIENPLLSEKTKKFTELVAESFSRVVEVESTGKGRLARMLSALYIGDYASAYLGLLYGHDPSATESIDYLKQS